MACIYRFEGRDYTLEELKQVLSKAMPGSRESYYQKIEEERPEETNSEEDLSPEIYKRLLRLYKEQVDALKSRLKQFETAKQSKGFVPQEETVNKIKDFLAKVKEVDEKQGFIELMQFTHNEMLSIEKWLKGEFNLDKLSHANVLLQIKRQLQTYEDLATNLPQFVENNTDLLKQAALINRLWSSVNELTNEHLEDYMVNFVEKNTTNKTKFPTKEDIREYLKESKDISFLEAKLGGMSSSEDTILALLHKIVEQKRQEIYDSINELQSRIAKAGDKLKAAGVKAFDWMIQKDENGRPTGRFVQRIGTAYFAARKEVMNLVWKDDGTKLEYITDIPFEEMTQAEKDHNIDLADRKKKISKFLKAEKTDKEGNTSDGDNHRYTEAFKEARKHYQQLVPGDYGWEWIKAEGVPEEVYLKFLRHYYKDIEEVWVAVRSYDEDTNTYNLTGEVELRPMQLPKNEFVEVTDSWEDEAFKSMMNESGAEGEAKREFYKFYTETFTEILKKLPLDVQAKMSGKLFRVKGDLIKDVSGKGIGFFKMVMKQLRKLVNPEIITSGRLLDENGNPISDVALFYVGDLRNDKKIASLEEKIKEHIDTKNTDKQELEKLKNALLIEKSKLDATEVNFDLVASLNAGAAMAENYDIMKSVEAVLLIAKQILKGKRWYKYVNKDGTPRLNSEGKIEYKEGRSNVEERLDSYLRMIFYNNSDANNTRIGMVANNFQRYTSLKLQALNPFAAINNAVMAGINQAVEAAGSQFYSPRNYAKATKIFGKYFLKAEWMDKFKNDPGYLNVPKNKLDAMVEKFNFLQRGAEINTKLGQKRSTKEYISSFDFLYAGLEVGEFQAQVRSAIAMMLETKLVSKDGVESNVWDAHEFINGELKLKEGFTYGQQDRVVLSGIIKNMNKTIHGNYSEEDKVAIQEYWLTNLALQFKKWMYNSIRNRFGNAYHDEGTGVDMKGRYRSIATFFTHLKLYGLKNYKTAYKSLDELEQANMRKNFAEMAYLFTAVGLFFLFDALAAGVDDDDEELKRTVNFLAKQSDRVRGELSVYFNPRDVYNSVKNPVAGLKIANEFMQFTGALAGVPWNLTVGNQENLYYQRGVNKDKMKVLKEARDLVPVLSQAGQYDQLLQSNNFFFK